MRFNSSYIIIPLLTIIVALAGRLLTQACDTWQWYETLNQSTLTPPGWVFGVVWNTIFVLTTIAAILVWNGFARSLSFWAIIGLFFANAILNVSWTLLFFNQRQIGMALLDAIVLEVVNVALIVLIAQRSKMIALLLVPYALWVGFAIYLNSVLWVIN